MKYILFIFIIAFTDYVFGQGDAPPLLQGQYQGSKSVGSFIQTPNSGVTKINSSTALIETGNNNILVNPSFEHQVFSTGWTNSAGTFTEETVVEIHGKKAAKLVLSSQTMALTQDSSLYAAQFADGVQGLASVRVKSDVALKVCSRSAGVTSSSLCVDVQANNKWGLYRVPFILGATSNGISIASTGAVTGTVYIDDAFVGAASLTQNMNACNDVSCETEFSAKISSSGVVSGENLDWLDSCSLVGTGDTQCNFKTGIFTVTPNCTITVETTQASAIFQIFSQSSSNIIISTATATVNDNRYPFNIICQKQGADFTAAKQLSNGNTYSSTNADTDWASCGHTAASFTGLGSVTNISTQCKRQGSDLLMKGRFTVGIPTAVEARLALPTWNGVQLTSAGSSVIPSLQLSGDMIYSASSTLYYRHATLIEPSVSYMTFGNQASTNAAYQKITGIVMSGNNQNFSFSSRIPIEGWQNSNIIIGQFNGLESCSSTLDCTDTFSAKVSAAGNVSDENVDWINGNCSWLSGSATCTFKTNIFTVSPNCNFTTSNAQGQRINITSISSTQFVIVNRSNDGTANVASDFHVICQKQGVDYVGKTAKAVASDQNLRTVGIINGEILSFSYGTGNASTACTASPCSYLDQIGQAITSVSRSSTGQYAMNFYKTFNKVKCTLSAVIPGSDYVLTNSLQCSNCSTLAFPTVARGTGSAADSTGTVVCHAVGL